MKNLRYKITKKINKNYVILNEEKEQQNKYSDYDLVCFDIETWGLNPSNLALACFFDGMKYYTYFSKQEILDYLDSLESNTIIYAHNGAKFDMVIFFDNFILDTNWKVKKYGDVYHFHYKNKQDKDIFFKDSYYILQSSLKNLAKDLLDKQEQKLELDEKFKNPEQHGFSLTEYRKNIQEYNIKNITQQDIEYCQRDVYSLYQIINHNLFKSYNFDMKNKNTIAGIAYEKLLLNATTQLVVDVNKDREFLQLYSGGITDVFKHENNDDKEIVCFDYNSFYPFTMTQEFGDPLNLERYYFEQYSTEKYNEEYEKWLNMINNYANGYSEIRIKVKDNLTQQQLKILKTVPLFPVWGMRFFDFTDNEEYELTIMNKEIVNILEFFNITILYSMYATKMIKPFKKYITEIYEQRLKNKDKSSLKLVLKLLMNSGYGRFGMKTQSDGMIEGNFQTIKDFILRELEKSAFREMDEGFTYIREVYDTKMEKINELDKNNLEKEFLDYVLNFIRDINNLDDNGFKIKNIERIPQQILNTDESMYILSYTTNKNPSLESSYYFASEITSKARSQLIQDIILIQKSKLGNVCYTDTDSMHIETSNVDKLIDFMNDNKMLDERKLGKLKNEGTYQKGFWFAKKHYYLFEKNKDNRLIFSKYALKGFQTEKNIDCFVHTRPAIFINKIYSRLTNVILETNKILQEKTFLNFITNRNSDNEFLVLNDFLNQDIILQHRLIIKDLFFKMLKRNDLYYQENGVIFKLTEDAINERIEFLKFDLEIKKAKGVYDFEFDNTTIANQKINKKLEKYLKIDEAEKGNKKEKKKRKSRAKPKNLKELVEFLQK